MECEYLKLFLPQICDSFQKTIKAVGDGLWGREEELVALSFSCGVLWERFLRLCFLGSVLSFLSLLW